MRITSLRNSEKRSRFLARTAKEAKNYSVHKKVGITLVSLLTLLTVLLYIIAALYKQTGSFTVSVDKYQMTKYGITLCENRDMVNKTSNLNANIDAQITNIAEEWLPDNLDAIDGNHSKDNYVAYTFYLQNTGAVEVPVEYAINISNITNDLDEAIRIRLYVDGEYTNYAKVKSDGTGPERGTQEFYNASTAVYRRIENFAPQETIKFTVVMWIEGNDPDCVDWLLGGKLKADMFINIVH